MAGQKIRGITVEIGGDTSGLNKALSNTNSEIRSTQSQLRDVEKLLKLDPSNTELLSQKQKLLADAVNQTNEKLKVLKEAQAKMDSGEVEKNQKAYDALSREIVSCENSLKELQKEAASSNVALTQAANAFDNAGAKLESIGKKASVASAAVTAVGVASVAAAKNLDAGYDTIITKTGASGEALEGLKEVADDIYSTMAVDMSLVGTAVGEVNTRFGATGSELEKLSKDFLQFAEINGTDVNNSIDSVDSIMAKFNIDTSNTANVLGLLTKAGQDSGISMDTLQNSLNTNGAALQELGFGLAESVNLLAQMEASGVDTTTGISSLKKAVTKLTDSGMPLNEALSTMIDSIKNAKTDTEALSIATETFGSKGAAEMSKAIRDGRLDIDNLSKSMEEYGSVVSDTFEATQDPWDEAEIATNNLKLAAADLGTQLLTTLAPTITSIVEGVKNFTQWFTNLDNNTKNLIVTIGLIIAAVGPLLIFLGQMASGVSAIIGVVQTLIPIISALNAVLAANPIGIIVIAIAGLIAAIVLLYQNCEWFRDGVNAIIEAIITFGKNAFESVKKFFTETIPSILNTVIDFFKDNWQGILLLLINPFAGAFKLLYDNCEGFRNMIDNFIDKIKTAFENMKTKIVNTAITIKNKIVETITGAINFIKELPNKALTWGKDLITGFINGIKNMASKLKDTVKGVASTITSFLHFSRPDEGPLRNYETWMPDFMDGLASGIKDNAYKVKDAVSSLSESMNINQIVSADVSGNTSVNNVTKVYLGDKELTNTITKGVVRKITNSQNGKNITKGGPAIV